MRHYVLVFLVAVAACGGDEGGPTGPTEGSLEIRTVTSGEVPPEGYTYRVDGQPAQPIGSNSTATRADLEPGAHVVQLAGLPDGCTASSDNPQTISIVAGSTAVAPFSINCVPPLGTLQVAVTSTGAAPASYDLVLDGTSQGPIGSTAIRALENIPSGAHSIGLSGLPANCEAGGENPLSATVRTGNTTEISFAVSCVEPAPETGALSITTNTTGNDPDGYRIAVDDGARQPIGMQGTLTLQNVAAGAHSVRLMGLATGCTPAAPNPQQVTVAAGTTATVAFSVNCAPQPTTGTVRVATSTSGVTTDTDGYAFTLDGGAPQPIGGNTAVTLDTVPAGTHTVALTDVPADCALDGNSARSLIVAGGGTAEARFVIRCAPVTVGQWSRMESGTAFSLYSVWGSSASDVFTVGEPGGSFESGIFHYDGQSWTRQATEQGVILYSVWGLGAGDVFAVGSDPLGANGYDGAILHFDGSAWSPMPGPGVASSDGAVEVSFYSVWGSSGTNVFAVGESNGGFSRALVARYDGAGWAEMPLPSRDNRVLTDVSGTSSEDVYAVGYFAQSFSLRRAAPRTANLRTFAEGFILHYDGTLWSEVLPLTAGLAFNAVWASAPNDVFAVGSANDAAAIYHYDGAGWSPVTIPPVGPLLDVWGLSATDVYAVGVGTMLHFDGQAWTEVQSVPQRLAGVWGSSAADVFTVGSGGTIIRGSLAGAPQP
jgi:hypothetical protein